MMIIKSASRRHRPLCSSCQAGHLYDGPRYRAVTHTDLPVDRSSYHTPRKAVLHCLWPYRRLRLTCDLPVNKRDGRWLRSRTSKLRPWPRATDRDSPAATAAKWESSSCPRPVRSTPRPLRQSTIVVSRIIHTRWNLNLASEWDANVEMLWTQTQSFGM